MLSLARGQGPAAQPDEVGAARWTSLLVFALCSIIMVAEGFDTYVVGYIGPVLVREWGLKPTAIGQLYAVGVAASLVGSILIGTLSDLLGRKWLLVLSTVLFGVATIGSAVATNLPALMMTRMLAGLGLGASIPCAMALGTEQASDRYRATVPVFMSTCIGAGTIVAGLTAAAVMPRYGWRGLMEAGAIFPLALAGPAALLLPRSTGRPALAPDAGVRGGAWRLLLEPRPFLLAAVVTLGLAATYTVTFFFGFWLPALISATAHNVRTVGLSTALIKTLSIFGALTVGRLMDRYGGARVLPWSFVISAMVLMFVVDDGHGLAPLILGLSVSSFFIDGSFSGIIGFCALAFPSHVRGAGMGVTIGVGRLVGGVLGPMLGGLLLGHGLSVRMTCAAFSAPLLVAALMVFIAGRIAAGRRAEPADAALPPIPFGLAGERQLTPEG